MKKLICLTIAIIMLVGLAACDTSNVNTSSEDSSQTVSTETNQPSSSDADESSLFGKSDVESSVSDVSKPSYDELTLKEFFASVKYSQLQAVAFSFVSAYLRSDREIALKTVKNADVLSKYFPDEGRTLDELNSYYIYAISFDSKEQNGTLTETATVCISVAYEEDAGVMDFILDMEYVDSIFIIEGCEYTQKLWKVAAFDLTT